MGDKFIVDARSYVDGIQAEIESIKSKGGTSLYRVNAKVSDNVAKHVQRWFAVKPGYTAETKKCMSCKGTWDILIRWKQV